MPCPYCTPSANCIADTVNNYFLMATACFARPKLLISPRVSCRLFCFAHFMYQMSRIDRLSAVPDSNYLLMNRRLTSLLNSRFIEMSSYVTLTMKLSFSHRAGNKRIGSLTDSIEYNVQVYRQSRGISIRSIPTEEHVTNETRSVTKKFLISIFL